MVYPVLDTIPVLIIIVITIIIIVIVVVVIIIIIIIIIIVPQFSSKEIGDGFLSNCWKFLAR